MIFEDILVAFKGNKELTSKPNPIHIPNFALILILFILETADNSSAKPAFLLHLLSLSTTVSIGLMES